MTCWFNKDSEPASLTVFAKNNGSGAREVELLVGDAGSNIAGVNVWVGASRTGINTPATITSGSWFHIVLSFDSPSHILSLYLNNAAPLTADVGGAAIDNSATANFTIGARMNTPADFFSGRIDQVGKRSSITTAAEVSQLWNGGNGLSWAAMQALGASRTTTVNLIMTMRRV